MSKKRPSMARIDIKSTKGLGELELGEEATITITGVVISMNAPREDYFYGPCGGKAAMMPGSIEIEISKVSVAGKSAGDPEDE